MSAQIRSVEKSQENIKTQPMTAKKIIANSTLLATIKRTFQGGEAKRLEKELLEMIDAARYSSVELFDPEVTKPRKSEDDQRVSVDVYIIDEDGLDGLAYFNFIDGAWIFHTDTLCDYYEDGNKTKWKWYYPPIKHEHVFPKKNHHDARKRRKNKRVGLTCGMPGCSRKAKKGRNFCGQHEY